MGPVQDPNWAGVGGTAVAAVGVATAEGEAVEPDRVEKAVSAVAMVPRRP